MDAEKRWTRYLFGTHSELELRRWAKDLQLFRFVRAVGGHSGIDYDSIEVLYLYHKTSELLNFFSYLGIDLVTYSQEPPRPKPIPEQSTRWYTAVDSSNCPWLIPGTRWIEQPGKCVIAGEAVFASCSHDGIRISISGEHPGVDEAVVSAGSNVEKELRSAPLHRLDPPRDHKHCICPKYYPDFFRA